MDLLERIQNANKRSEQNNRKSAEAQAQLKLLTTQISELVANYKQKFGISFPNIEDEAKFTKFVNDLLTQTEADLEQKVTVAEKVNQLILDGDILGAQKLLGYEPEEESVEDLEEAEESKVAEVELEDVEEVELEDIAPKRVIEDEPIAPVKRRMIVEDEEEAPVVQSVKSAPRRTVVVDDDEEPVAPAKPVQRRTVVDDLDDLEETPVVRPRKSPVVTSNFDMGEDEDAGVSLKELNAVAGVAPRGVSQRTKSPVVMDDLEEEEIVVRPRKRAIIVDEDDSDDVAPARPVRSGGSFKFD